MLNREDETSLSKTCPSSTNLITSNIRNQEKNFNILIDCKTCDHSFTILFPRFTNKNEYAINLKLTSATISTRPNKTHNLAVSFQLFTNLVPKTATPQRPSAVPVHWCNVQRPAVILQISNSARRCVLCSPLANRLPYRAGKIQFQKLNSFKLNSFADNRRETLPQLWLHAVSAVRLLGQLRHRSDHVPVDATRQSPIPEEELAHVH